MRRPKESWLSEALLALIAVPVLGVLMGGIYFLPAMKLSKEREPSLTLLLSFGLGITVFGLGCLLRTPLTYLVGAWVFSLVLLGVSRRAYGSLGHNVERFGVVHAAALLITALVSAAAHITDDGRLSLLAAERAMPAEVAA